MTNSNYYVLVVISGIAGGISSMIFGGLSAGLQCLLICMGIDIITGVIAAYRNNSPKTEDGGINSGAMWKGVSKKVLTLCIVAASHQADVLAGSASAIRDAVIVAFAVVEIVSVIENAGLAGVPIPKRLSDAISVLKGKNQTISAEDSIKEIEAANTSSKEEKE